MTSDGENSTAETKPPPATSSEVVLVDNKMIAAATVADTLPPISQLNVTNSSKVHVGPKYISVISNIKNTEEIKELPLPQYIWHVIKFSSRVERLLCAVAVTALLICIALTVYFTMSAKTIIDDDVAPHAWNITREMWLAEKPIDLIKMNHSSLPLVMVQHTVSSLCLTFKTCAAEIRNLQLYFQNKLNYGDIPYNFMIGNDNRVYEGRGWGVLGAHTLNYNNCSMGLAFVGDYREIKATDLQLNRTLMLLEEGVKRGFLHPNYKIVGACDVKQTASPGTNLYNAMKKLKHFDYSGRFRDKSCSEVYEMVSSDN